MHYMHDLKDLLCAELEDYAEKGKKSGKMSMGDLESGYSEDGHYMGEGRIYGTSYDGYDRGTSYARGRGRYAKRDSMGRYSSRGMSYDDDMSYARGGRGGNRGYSRDDGKAYMMEQLEEMMEQAQKPAEKEALRSCMDALKRA